MIMKILVFGNNLVKEDSLAIEILPKLKELFPKIEFIETDGIENLEGSPIILDVVENLKKARLISIDEIKTDKICSMHDCDLAFNLLLLKKINKINNATIIGIPQEGDKKQVIEELKQIISSISLENE